LQRSRHDIEKFFRQMSMTWIKICGTTNLKDARLSIDAGADALGFIFAESPRRIGPPAARKIVAKLPKNIEKVGVFVNETTGRIRQVVEEVGLTAVQLHGDEQVNFLRALREEFLQVRVYKTLLANSRLKDALIEFRGPNPPDGILVDTAVNGKRGGTGLKSDWRVLASAMSGQKSRWIIAGGLTPQNVADAIEMFHPWGVDVVSGVESSPGKKDPEKLNAFVRAVRAADKNHEKSS
jgi:phosphoribosylanthranilate isomerase